MKPFAKFCYSKNEQQSQNFNISGKTDRNCKLIPILYGTVTTKLISTGAEKF